MNRRRLQVFYSDHLDFPLPEGHRFPLQKYRALRKDLLKHAIVTPSQLHPAPFATPAQLECAHEAAYVQSALEGTLSDKMVRALGLPWSPQLVRRALASAGGTLMAARTALEQGISGNLAGGTHHAGPSNAAGFCLFNDLAVTALVLLKEKRLQRALIVDLDVHQGDGTAEILQDHPTLWTFSIHGAKNYPFRKKSSHTDVALPNFCEDEEYLAALQSQLPRLLRKLRPELILYQAGVDALSSDRLGKLSLSHQGLLQRDQFVLSLAKKAHIPLVLTMGGGYAQPIEDSLLAHLNTYRVAQEMSVPTW